MASSTSTERAEVPSTRDELPAIHHWNDLLTALHNTPHVQQNSSHILPPCRPSTSWPGHQPPAPPAAEAQTICRASSCRPCLVHGGQATPRARAPFRRNWSGYSDAREPSMCQRRSKRLLSTHTNATNSKSEAALTSMQVTAVPASNQTVVIFVFQRHINSHCLSTVFDVSKNYTSGSRSRGSYCLQYTGHTVSNMSLEWKNASTGLRHLHQLMAIHGQFRVAASDGLLYSWHR